jgi:two-component system, NarL family, sensor kinase
VLKQTVTILFLGFVLSSEIAFCQTRLSPEDSVRKISELISSRTRMQLDSVLRLLHDKKEDTVYVKRLNYITRIYINLSFDSAVMYAKAAKEIAKKINYGDGLSQALRNHGTTYETLKRDWTAAVPYYDEAMKVAEENELYDLMHESYSVILNTYFYLGDFPNAMNVATRGLNSAAAKNDHSKMILYNNLIGTIYQRQENYEEALKTYQQSLQMADKMNQDNERTFAYLGLAEVYLARRDSARAFPYLFNSLDIARELFDKPSHRFRHKIAFILYRIGYGYKIFGNAEEGLKYTLDALAFTRIVPCDLFDIANYYLQAGDIYRHLNDYSAARENLYKGLAIATAIGHKEDTRDAYGYLAEVFADEKKYDSAFIYSQLHMRLKDSIVNEITRYRTEEIKAIYDVKEKDKVIARQENIRNLMIGLFALLLLTIAFLYNRYRLRQKNRYQRELNRQQNELFNAIAAAQDQERKRIAQDIHDSLGSVLSAAKLKLSALKESQDNLSPEETEKYQSTLKLLDEASAELRNISHNIMPATLSKLGLVAALKNLINTISSHSGLQISFSAHDFIERLDEQTEMSIYRIILELINNVVKHAEADKVTVQLIKYPEYINISIEDNGKGFDYDRERHAKKGIGLGNILSRVEYLKGTINVDASEGRGTTVIIDVPYRAA